MGDANTTAAIEESATAAIEALPHQHAPLVDEVLVSEYGSVAWSPGAVFGTLPATAVSRGEGGDGLASPAGAGEERIVLSEFLDETQLESIMALIAKDLSEPYSVFTYRAFLHGWPQLALLVRQSR